MKRKVSIKRDYETEHGDFSLESQGVWPAKRYRYIAEVLGNSMHLPYKKRIVSEWHADKIQAIICATEFLAENHAEREMAWEEERKLDRELADAIKRGAEMFTAPHGYTRYRCDESCVSPAVIKSLKKKKEETVKIELAKCKKCGGSGCIVVYQHPSGLGYQKKIDVFAECTACGKTICEEAIIQEVIAEWNETNKEEPMQFENGKIYQVKSPETGNIYPAFWSSDRERFVVLQLVAGGEVNTFELEKGCVVEMEE